MKPMLVAAVPCLGVGVLILAERILLCLQATHIYKSRYVPHAGHLYQPEKCPANTVFAGTVIKQVWVSGLL